MRRSLRAFSSAVVLGVAVLASGSASAAATPGEAFRSAQAQAYPGESYAQRRHVHGGGRMMGGGHRGFHGGHGHRGGFRGGRGAAAAAGIGLGLGLLGAAIAAQQPAAPVYGGGPGWNRYCFRKFGPTFDPGSGTYLAANGYRYPCQ